MDIISTLDATARMKKITHANHELLANEPWDIDLSTRQRQERSRSSLVEDLGSMALVTERELTTRRFLSSNTTRSFSLSVFDRELNEDTGLREQTSYLYLPYRDMLGTNICLLDGDEPPSSVIEWIHSNQPEDIDRYWQSLQQYIK